MANKNSDYYNQQGNIFLQGGLFDQALNSYLKAISLNNYQPAYYHNAGVCLMEKNEFKRALDLFKKALDLKINIDETKFYYIKSAYKSNTLIDYSETLIPKENKYKINSYVLLAKLYTKNNKKDKARIIIKKIKLLGFVSQEIELIENLL